MCEHKEGHILKQNALILVTKQYAIPPTTIASKYFGHIIPIIAVFPG